MKIYLARHGQTDWNVEMRAQGRKDLPLNATGREQAEKMRDNIKDLELDAVYASPLKRAAETAEIATRGKHRIIYDDRLVERSFGEYEGKIVKSWLELVEGVDISDISLEGIPGGVETVKSMLSRVHSFIKHLKQQYDDDSRILIVTHGGISKAFDWVLMGRSGNSIADADRLNNAEVREYNL